MNANQVVIVMDRDGAETLTGKTGKHSSDCAGPGWDCDCGAANEGRARMRRGRAALRAALDRDPDELVEQIARIIHAGSTSIFAYEDEPDWFKDRARSVLAVLGEEGTK